MNGDILIVLVLIAVAVLLFLAGIAPKLKKYRLKIERVEPRSSRKRHVKAKTKKRKSVWVKVI